jgi:hypothetical protein
VILPSLPVPVTDAGRYFSSNIFLLLEMVFLKHMLLLVLLLLGWALLALQQLELLLNAGLTLLV